MPRQGHQQQKQHSYRTPGNTRAPHFKEAPVPHNRHSWKYQTSWIRGKLLNSSVTDKEGGGPWVGVTHFEQTINAMAGSHSGDASPQPRIPLPRLLQLPHSRNRRDRNPLQSWNADKGSWHVFPSSTPCLSLKMKLKSALTRGSNIPSWQAIDGYAGWAHQRWPGKANWVGSVCSQFCATEFGWARHKSENPLLRCLWGYVLGMQVKVAQWIGWKVFESEMLKGMGSHGWQKAREVKVFLCSLLAVAAQGLPKCRGGCV